MNCWLWPGENQLLYIDGGDLYFYNGSERSRAASDIEYVWNAAAVNRQPG